MNRAELVKAGKKLVAQQARSNWEWGDLAVEVAPEGSPNLEALKEWADEIGFEETGKRYETLRRYRRTALAWPQTGRSARRQGGSWAAHDVLAPNKERCKLWPVGKKMSKRDAVALLNPEKDDAEVEAERLIADDPALAEEVAHQYAELEPEPQPEPPDPEPSEPIDRFLRFVTMVNDAHEIARELRRIAIDEDQDERYRGQVVWALEACKQEFEGLVVLCGAGSLESVTEEELQAQLEEWKMEVEQMDGV